jgi:hypothetical protein
LDHGQYANNRGVGLGAISGGAKKSAEYKDRYVEAFSDWMAGTS